MDQPLNSNEFSAVLFQIQTDMSKFRWIAWIPVFCAAAFAQHQNPPAEASETGTAVFRRHCASCHGKGGEGGRAPSLTGRLRAGDSDADVFRTISAGIPGTEMSSYDPRLGSEKISRIVSYLRSVKRSEPPMAGDAARGAAVFWG